MTRPTAAAPARSSQSRPFWEETAGHAATVMVALVVALILRIVLFQPFTIPSSSMEPGLVIGDYIIVSKFAYGWSRASLPFNLPLLNGRLFGRLADRGDIVVFRLPRNPRQTWIKRVIGLPGDRVQVQSGAVYVNGRRLPQVLVADEPDHDEPARMVTLVRETLPNGRGHWAYGGAQDHEGENTGVYVVPPDSYFVMGDNRDNSLDSRWPADLGVGFLPAGNLVGKAEFVMASWRAGSAVLKPWTWFDLQPELALRPIR